MTRAFCLWQVRNWIVRKSCWAFHSHRLKCRLPSLIARTHDTYPLSPSLSLGIFCHWNTVWLKDGWSRRDTLMMSLSHTNPRSIRPIGACIHHRLERKINQPRCLLREVALQANLDLFILLVSICTLAHLAPSLVSLTSCWPVHTENDAKLEMRKAFAIIKEFEVEVFVGTMLCLPNRTHRRTKADREILSSSEYPNYISRLSYFMLFKWEFLVAQSETAPII